MHDILFNIPLPFTDAAIPIRSYGVMAALGFLAGLGVARWRAKRVLLCEARAAPSPDHITDLALWALFGGIIGARVVYVVQNAKQYFDRTRPDWSFLDMFKIWQGGLVFYGGLIVAGIVVVTMTYRRKGRLLAVLDVVAPSVALAHVFGRIGCFLRGCCYGISVAPDAWYGVIFPENAPAYTYSYGAARYFEPGTSIFPVQLLSSLDLLVIFGILSLFFKHRRGEGQVAGLYLLLYSVHRFLIEFLRGDTRLQGEFSQAQWTAVFTFFIGLGLMVYALGNAARASESSSGKKQNLSKASRPSGLKPAK